MREGRAGFLGQGLARLALGPKEDAGRARGQAKGTGSCPGLGEGRSV